MKPISSLHRFAEISIRIWVIMLLLTVGFSWFMEILKIRVLIGEIRVTTTWMVKLEGCKLDRCCNQSLIWLNLFVLILGFSEVESIIRRRIRPKIRIHCGKIKFPLKRTKWNAREKLKIRLPTNAVGALGYVVLGFFFFLIDFCVHVSDSWKFKD